MSVRPQCDGFLNWGKYCSPSLGDALAQARQRTEPWRRQPLHKQASAIHLDERPPLFLWHHGLFWAMSDKVAGFRPRPDGVIRLRGVRLAGR